MGKYNALVEDIIERNEKGQPILVGTISVEKSELVSELLDKRGIHHNVLNAKLHAKEADVVAQAGRIGSVTVATNMAGRGVDIILGGNPEALAERDLRSEGLEQSDEKGVARYNELLNNYQTICSDEGKELKMLAASMFSEPNGMTVAVSTISYEVVQEDKETLESQDSIFP